MNKVARMTKRVRADLFAETAERRGLSDAVVEKDFWVCWTLKQLFAIDALRDRLLFKGGTSLSKIYHAINRFSEDIDLHGRPRSAPGRIVENQARRYSGGNDGRLSAVHRQ